MDYFFKQKFNITELADRPAPSLKIIIMETEEYLVALYTRYLQAHDFVALHCKEAGGLKDLIVYHQPDLLIIGSGAVLDPAFLLELLFDIKRIFSTLPVITIGNNISPQMLKQLMSAGISGHIDRRLSKPEDVVAVVKTILQKNI